MKRQELVNLKKLLQEEIYRINRRNELLSNDLVQEFVSLCSIDIENLNANDKWSIIKNILIDYPITESNGILVYTDACKTDCDICYQETTFYTINTSLDDSKREYQIFRDIETNKHYLAYADEYINTLILERNRYYGENLQVTPSEFCHSKYSRDLVSELQKKYIILNPYNTHKNSNGFDEVQELFFTTAIEKGQPKAKQLLLSKYPQMK